MVAVHITWRNKKKKNNLSDHQMNGSGANIKTEHM